MTRTPSNEIRGESAGELFPQLSRDQAVEAEETLEDYVQSTLRLYERISADPAAHEAFRAALTAWENRSRMEVERPMPASQ